MKRRFGSPLLHIAGLLLRPASEWRAIAADGETTARVVARIVPFCAIPALATLVGMSVFDAGWDPQHGYRVARDMIVVTALGNFAFAVGTIVLLALLFRWLAPSPGGRRASLADAMKVAAYGAVPILLAGVFLVLPVLIVIVLVAGLHTLFLYNLGLRTVLGVRGEEAPMLLAVGVVLASLAAGILGALAAWIGLF